MARTLIAFVLGILLTLGATYSWTMNSATGLMIVEDQSVLDFDTTVAAITAGAESAGWKVPAVHPISKSVTQAGFDVGRLTVIELCKADLAGKILTEGGDLRVASMMPCRVAVYEKSDGSVILSRMNSTLMSKLFGGVIATTMAEAAAQNEQIFSAVLETR